MTKAELIEALKDYPDDAAIAVSVGFPGVGLLAPEDYSWVDKPGGLIYAISVGSRTDAIVLEL